VILALLIWPLGAEGVLAQGLPIMAYAVLVAAARLGLARGYPHPRFGACNTVTYLRATGVAGLTAVLALPAAPLGGWLVPGVAAVILAADGIDGWLARRARRISDFGARFDMETDAALALVLAALIWQSGLAGAWVLWLGLARYAFVAGGWLLPWLRAPLPPRWRRKAGCVVQIGALVLALVPGLPEGVALMSLAAAGVLLAWSFGADVAWLHRHRRSDRLAASSGQTWRAPARGAGDRAA
jgi:phosphatidylglycerophosphate synthase